jgi:uncharacterized iron-regulated membrane protein
MSAAKWNRKLHRWGAVLVAAPVLVIIVTGVLLQLKKEWSWIQPPTMAGTVENELALSWDQVLEAVKGVPQAEVETWSDIDRLDVRPGKGMLKVRANNRWEVQLDTTTGEVLASSHRRSDLIEAIHDGSWFHDRAKFWIWLPTAFILCGLWGTGVYLWLLPHLIKRRRKLKDPR